MFVENQILKFKNNKTNNRLIYKNTPMKRNNDKNIIKNKTTSFGFSTFHSNQKIKLIIIMIIKEEIFKIF